jgi:hypothetical protein
MAKRPATVIAETLGWDINEVLEYGYQRTASPRVYAIGQRYFAAHPTKPRHDVGGEWREHTDQFGARGTKMKVWVADAIGESK